MLTQAGRSTAEIALVRILKRVPICYRALAGLPIRGCAACRQSVSAVCAPPLPIWFQGRVPRNTAPFCHRKGKAAGQLPEPCQALDPALRLMPLRPGPTSALLKTKSGSTAVDLPEDDENHMRVLLIGCLLLGGATSAPEEALSAGDIIRGCRAGIVYYKSPSELVQQGYCAGMVAGIWEVAVTARWACLPETLSLEALTRKVVKYIDAQPARLQEKFSQLALEAIQATWPCPRP